jgi:hypothetical protein
MLDSMDRRIHNIDSNRERTPNYYKITDHASFLESQYQRAEDDLA